MSMIVIRARKLRNSPTPAERLLWHSLRKRQLGGYKFTRQFPIGNFIVDFCCRERGLVIEVDGGGHDNQRGKDEARTRFLHVQGFIVLRFWNNDVLRNLAGVIDAISEVLNEVLDEASNPPSSSLP